MPEPQPHQATRPVAVSVSRLAGGPFPTLTTGRGEARWAAVSVCACAAGVRNDEC